MPNFIMNSEFANPSVGKTVVNRDAYGVLPALFAAYFGMGFLSKAVFPAF